MESDKPSFWDSVESKPASNVQLTRDTVVATHIDSLIQAEQELYKLYDISKFYQYKKGAAYRVINEDDYTQFLERSIKLTFQCIRDHLDQSDKGLEEVQSELIKISKLETVMVDLVSVLKTFDFKLDKNFLHI